jgi:hypothetical protein
LKHHRRHQLRDAERLPEPGRTSWETTEWLRSEGISEGPGSVVQINRWMRDPAGSGVYRIPDVRLTRPGVIMDATIGHKGWSSLQIRQFHSFSSGNRITIVRPTQLGGSYSLIVP